MVLILSSITFQLRGNQERGLVISKINIDILKIYALDYFLTNFQKDNVQTTDTKYLHMSHEYTH